MSAGEPIRLLARHSQYGYTGDPAKAMIFEPEAVSRDDQVLLTARAHRTAHDLQLAQWREHRAEIARRRDWLYTKTTA